jgi:hypothetical protein
MLQRALPVILIALAVPLGAAVEPDAGTEAVQLTQFTIRQRVVIRIPRVAAAPLPKATPVRWKEKRGPRCIASADLRGAMVTGDSAVDLVMTGGRRLRAKLDNDCGPLDFYSGFYLKRAEDGSVCAGRDLIRARSGSACQITAFRTLQPRP